MLVIPDAMDGAGTLTLTTRADRDHVVVEIGDTGTIGIDSSPGRTTLRIRLPVRHPGG
jgi:hypothetical protein